MTFATIDALRESLAQPASKIVTPEYRAKMLHSVPTATSVDRAAFILSQCAGKRVLDVGASGAMHTKIRDVAAVSIGLDRVGSLGVFAIDLDDVTRQDLGVDGLAFDVIVCGEVLEHLSNPGWFLTRLRRQYPDVPVIVTVPNAFSESGAVQLARGTENVNIDHTAWYSYRTLRTLLERHGYTIELLHWYGGEPLFAEGLIVVTL